MKNIGDGFYLNSYLYHGSPESERRYQVIYSARDMGHPHIENSVAAGFTTEAAVLRWIDDIKHDPEWKAKTESEIISSLLNGYATKYQLTNFDSLFTGWSEHEKAIALKLLTDRAEKLQDGSYAIAVTNDIQRQLENKESCTSYGEPQAFYSLKNGRSIEVIIEQEGLSPSEYYYSVSLHCTETEFDNGDYNSTGGVLERYSSSCLNKDELSELVAGVLACNDAYPIAEHSKEPLEVQISAAENGNFSKEVQQNDYIEQER